jgi:DNA invertase Pin-like site-specific DNA recombinase
MERWARYGRVSTLEQEDALTRQLFELEQCFIENSWKLDDDLLFVDEQSGWNDDEAAREAFSRLLGLVRTRSIYGIVVTRTDRLARETEILARLWKILERQNIKLFVIEKGRSYDPSNHSDWIDFINDATAAEGESRKISGRVGRAWKYNRYMERANSTCPFGYRRSPEKKYEPDLAQWLDTGLTVWAAARRQIDILFECDMNEREAMRRIDAELSKHWSIAGFRVWLVNEVLRGDIAYLRYYGDSVKHQKKQSRHADPSQGFGRPKEILHDRHTPLITRDEAAQIADMIAIKKPRGKNAGGNCRILPLSGLVKCAICGGAATFSTDGKYSYAYCRARRNRRATVNTRGQTSICGTDPLNDQTPKAKHGKSGISHAKLENAVIAKLCESAEAIAHSLIENTTSNLPTPETLKREESIRRLQKLIDETGDESGLLQQQIRVWRSQIPQSGGRHIDADLRRRLAETFSMTGFAAEFLKQSPEKRRAVYRQFVQSVYVRHSEVDRIELKASLGSLTIDQ